MLNKRKLLTAACVAALALAGCGDGGNRPTPTPDAAGYPAPIVEPTQSPVGYPAIAETPAPPTNYPAPTP
jgi:hypothetical protein